MALRLTDAQIHWIVDHLLLELEKSSLLQVPATHSETKKALFDEIQQNINEEVAIEKQAKELLEKNIGALRGSGAPVDEHKAYSMIKKQLAQQKGFVL